MGKRPLSKLAVISLIAPLFTVGIIIVLASNIINEADVEPIILIFGAISIFALIISIWSLKQIKHNNLRGKIFSVVGIVLSILIIALYGFVFWIMLSNRGHSGHAESSAVAGLKMLVSQEAIWRQQDPDGNGIKDYWTYDISCFNRTYRADGITKCNFIDIYSAKADMAPASLVGGAIPFDTPQIEPWTEITPTSHSGYCYMAMISDENSMPYNQNPVGPNKIPATSSSKFAFVAYPDSDVYGKYAINTFIINEKGIVYARDMGSDTNKIILRWPNDIEMNKWKTAE
ncbi:MAG: DUF2950 family protein [Planctomycetota bacterium]